MITLAYINETTMLTDNLIRSYVAAQQVQISRDFASVWGIDATCVFVPPGQPIPVGAWIIYLQDHVSEAGCYGFHDDTGCPKAYVAVADSLADGCSWTVTASHETMEMLLDPMCDAVVDVGNLRRAKECADAPEDDRYAHAVQGHHLSNAVTPSWFDPNGKAPYTIYPCAAITRPFQLAPGGYIGEMTLPSGVWTQVTMGELTPRMVKRPTSRTMRRFAS